MSHTASSKLYGADNFDPCKTSHVLAILGQRFGLNITFGLLDSVDHTVTGVESTYTYVLRRPWTAIGGLQVIHTRLVRPQAICMQRLDGQSLLWRLC